MPGRTLMSAMKWLYPGMRVKRWLMLVPVAMALVVAGVVLLANWRLNIALNHFGAWIFQQTGVNISAPSALVPIGLGMIVLGLIVTFSALRQVISSITSVVSPEAKGKLADVIFQRRYLSQGQRIVVIGGGTGLSTMLRGLKQFSSNLVAIVTVTDDGGSSGRLQREMGMMPPGDIRNCLVAMADAEPLMTELFQYRFDENIDGLDGHTFGNLLIAAMTRITGDFERAVRETSNILAIRGLVLPSTIDDVKLQAELEDGSFIEGETNIVRSPKAVKRIMLHPSTVMPLDEALRSIELADCIVLGPGSVYTSIIPNLLVHGIPEAIERSQAVKAFVCNVMTQPGETDGFTASDHISSIMRHTESRIFHYAIVNTVRPSSQMMEKYEHEHQRFVEPDVHKIRELGLRPLTGDFISQTNVVRHDPDKLAQAILKLL
jgi:uncharacterized cofD-like protein